MLTNREAIAQLAEMVGTLAARCWEPLGTELARRINEDCFNLVKELRESDDTPGDDA